MTRAKVSQTAGPENAAGSTVENADVLGLDHAERMVQLRLEVQAGMYEVSAEAVAKALIDAHFKE